jgi:hypothetical protein
MFPEILDVVRNLEIKNLEFELAEWEDGYCITVVNDKDEEMQVYQCSGSYLSELGLLEIIVYNNAYDYKTYADVDYTVDLIVNFMNQEG